MAKLMFDELKEMLCNELNNVAKKGGLNKDSLETTHKLASSLNDLVTANAMLEGDFDGYSGMSYRNDIRRGYDNGNYSYNRGYDGRRGRDGDNDGRYNERNYYDGYSSHDMSTMDRLENMLRMAKTEQEREQIKRWMREANN